MPPILLDHTANNQTLLGGEVLTVTSQHVMQKMIEPQSGYPGCSQAEETVVMRSLLWYKRLIAYKQPEP